MTKIFEKGPRCEENFVGNAYINYLNSGDVYNCKVYDVYFEAGARNNWHIHKGNGQILLCTDGIGYYQEKGKTARCLKKGDVVEVPPNVEHWHGAAPNSDFSHIGVSPNLSIGSYIWLQPVSDEEYLEATKNKPY